MTRAAMTELHERFHWGNGPDGELPVFGPVDAPKHLALLGELVEITLDDGRRIEGGLAWLAAGGPAPHELYIVGATPITLPASGRMARVTYATTKRDVSARWEHPFDEPYPWVGNNAGGVAVVLRRPPDEPGAEPSRYGIAEPGIYG